MKKRFRTLSLIISIIVLTISITLSETFLTKELGALMSMNYTSEAIKISGVNVIKKDESIPGFELLTSVLILIITFFYRKRKEFP